jgi:hypothetical protein
VAAIQEYLHSIHMVGMDHVHVRLHQTMEKQLLMVESARRTGCLVCGRFNNRDHVRHPDLYLPTFGEEDLIAFISIALPSGS